MMCQYVNNLEVLVMKHCAWSCEVDTIPLHSFHIINTIITVVVFVHCSMLFVSIIIISTACNCLAVDIAAPIISGMFSRTLEKVNIDNIINCNNAQV